MAKIYPENLSKEKLEDPRLGAERKVYNSLKSKLGNDWTVFYNVEWVGKVNDKSSLRDGEIDFLLFHEIYGLFICEVKGGVRIISRDDKWISISKLGNEHQINNPFTQARSNKYALVKIMEKEISGFSTEKLNISHVIIFPDISKVSGDFPLNSNEEIVIYEHDLMQIGQKLKKLYEDAYVSNPKSINYNRTLAIIVNEWIKNKIYPNVDMTRSIRNWIKDTEAEIFTLTSKQILVLENLKMNKRVTVLGCAGSGKTLIATNKAIDMSKTGYKTLLCCFNSILGYSFSNLNSKYTNLMASNFHKIIEKLSIYYNLPNSNFSTKLDALTSLALNDSFEKFDVIIIDEIQDFTEDQIEFLELILAKDGYLYSFGDLNQSILHDKSHLPTNSFVYLLNENLRNTKQIFNKFRNFYNGDTELACLGPSGSEVVITDSYNYMDDKALYSCVKKELNKLIHTENVDPSDIVILTFKSQETSALRNFEYQGLNVVAFDTEFNGKGLRIESARRFKGLDSSIVILTELDDFGAMSDELLWNNLCYTSLSRARSMLIIIPPSNVNLAEILKTYR